MKPTIKWNKGLKTSHNLDIIEQVLIRFYKDNNIDAKKISVIKTFNEGMSNSDVLLIEKDDHKHKRVFKLGPKVDAISDFNASKKFISKIHSPYIADIKYNFIEHERFAGFEITYGNTYLGKDLPPLKKVLKRWLENLNSQNKAKVDIFNIVSNIFNLFEEHLYQNWSIKDLPNNYFYKIKFPDVEFDGFEENIKVDSPFSVKKITRAKFWEITDDINYKEPPDSEVIYKVNDLDVIAVRENHFYVTHNNRVIKVYKSILLNDQSYQKLEKAGIRNKHLEELKSELAGTHISISTILGILKNKFSTKDDLTFHEYERIVKKIFWTQSIEKGDTINILGRINATGHSKNIDLLKQNKATGGDEYLKSQVENLFSFRNLEQISCSSIHGDLHDQNILASEDGTPFLIDFAKFEEEGPLWYDYAKLEISLRSSIYEYMIELGKNTSTDSPNLLSGIDLLKIDTLLLQITLNDFWDSPDLFSSQLSSVEVNLLNLFLILRKRAFLLFQDKSYGYENIFWKEEYLKNLYLVSFLFLGYDQYYQKDEDQKDLFRPFRKYLVDYIALLSTSIESVKDINEYSYQKYWSEKYHYYYQLNYFFHLKPTPIDKISRLLKNMFDQYPSVFRAIHDIEKDGSSLKGDEENARLIKLINDCRNILRSLLFKYINFIRVKYAKEKEKRSYFTDLRAKDYSIPLSGAPHSGSSSKEKGSDAIKLINSYSNLVVIGDPGSGKSTVAHQLSFISANEKYKGYIPIIFSFNDLYDYFEEDINHLTRDSFTDYLFHIYDIEKTASPYEKEVFIYCLIGGIFQIIGDGFNEISPEWMAKSAEIIKQFKKAFPHNKYLISSRTIHYIGSQLFRPFPVVELLKLERRESEIFIRKRIKEETKANNLIKIVFESGNFKSITDLASSPLFLTMIVQYYQKKQRIPESRAQLFDGFIEEYMVRDLKVGQGIKFERKYKDELLRQLAFENVTNAGTSISEKDTIDLMFRHSTKSEELYKILYFPKCLTEGLIKNTIGYKEATDQLKISVDELYNADEEIGFRKIPSPVSTLLKTIFNENHKGILGNNIIGYQEAPEMMQIAFNEIYTDILENGIVAKNHALTFVHQSIQEYYAAYILAQQLANNKEAFYDNIIDKKWKESALILVGFVFDDYKEEVKTFLSELPNLDLKFMVDCIISAEFTEASVKNPILQNLTGILYDGNEIINYRKQVVDSMIDLRERWKDSFNPLFKYLSEAENPNEELCIYIISKFAEIIEDLSDQDVDHYLDLIDISFSTTSENLHKAAFEGLKAISANNVELSIDTILISYIMQEYPKTFDNLRLELYKFFEKRGGFRRLKNLEELLSDRFLPLAEAVWQFCYNKNIQIDDSLFIENIESGLMSTNQEIIKTAFESIPFYRLKTQGYQYQRLMLPNFKIIAQERIVWWYDHNGSEVLNEWITNLGRQETELTSKYLHSIFKRTHDYKNLKNWLSYLGGSSHLSKAEIESLMNISLEKILRSKENIDLTVSDFIWVIRKKELFAFMPIIGRFALSQNISIKRYVKNALEELRKSENPKPLELQEMLNPSSLLPEDFKQLAKKLESRVDSEATIAMFTLCRPIAPEHMIDLKDCLDKLSYNDNISYKRNLFLCWYHSYFGPSISRLESLAYKFKANRFVSDEDLDSFFELSKIILNYKYEEDKRNEKKLEEKLEKWRIQRIEESGLQGKSEDFIKVVIGLKEMDKKDEFKKELEEKDPYKDIYDFYHKGIVYLNRTNRSSEAIKIDDSVNQIIKNGVRSWGNSAVESRYRSLAKFIEEGDEDDFDAICSFLTTYAWTGSSLTRLNLEEGNIYQFILNRLKLDNFHSILQLLNTIQFISVQKLKLYTDHLYQILENFSKWEPRIKFHERISRISQGDKVINDLCKFTFFKILETLKKIDSKDYYRLVMDNIWKYENDGCAQCLVLLKDASDPNDEEAPYNPETISWIKDNLLTLANEEKTMSALKEFLSVMKDKKEEAKELGTRLMKIRKENTNPIIQNIAHDILEDLKQNNGLNFIR